VLPTIAALLALSGSAAAQEPAVVTETLRVPTVDGKEVSVEIKRPDGVRAPVILTYSPYNAIRPALGDDVGDRYVPKGYARAIADVLGTRNSSGCWDYGGPKEQQSGVDLVNFLAKQPWSNGKVAMIGGSYDGTTANMVAVRGADVPGLAAIVPEAAIGRWYGYAYQGGVRYLGNGQHPTDEGFDTPLAFDFGFSRTPPEDPTQVQALQDHLHPCDAAEHTEHGYDQSPDYDDFWKQRDYRKDASKIRVPVLFSHGWQDFNVKQDEGVAMYAAVDRAPWKGIWLGQYEHGSPGTDEWWTLLDQFFDRFLKDQASGLPANGAVVSQPRDHGVAADPQRLASWPPQRTGDIELKLGRGEAGGTLGPASGEPALYTDGGQSEEAIQEDPAAERSWLTYTTEPATEDARIAGAPVLDATVALINRDTGHLTPTLFDVAPDGTVVPITRGFLNLRYRDGLETEKAVPLNQPVRAVVQFLPQDWVVRKGHRLALAIASSNSAWAVPHGRPGLGVQVRHGGASRLLVPLVGAGRQLPPQAVLPALPQAQRPAELLVTAAVARKRLRVALRRGKRPRTLVVTGRAPSRTSIFLRFTRGKRIVRDRSVGVRKGRFRLTIRVGRPGTYRVSARLRTREGVFTRRSARIRVR
jgi:X-Pro dipeptidyl-peptidase